MRCNCPSTCASTGTPSRNSRFCISVAIIEEMPPEPMHSTLPELTMRAATPTSVFMSRFSLARWMAAIAASVMAVAMRCSRASRFSGSGDRYWPPMAIACAR